MKKYILLILFLLTGSGIFPQANQWTWMKGKNTWDGTGAYGTKGVPAPTNTPTHRNGSAGWTDINGDLWLFGGLSSLNGWDDAFLNDLWKYSVATNQWTWVSGDKEPNQRGVYGTLGVPRADNKPGGRYGSASWIDASGDLWIFGGYGASSTDDTYSDYYKYLNDLWKYSVATNQWTWIKGDNRGGNRGVYGEQGVPDPANKPGARMSGISWTDAAGNFWLLGGFVVLEGGSVLHLNDLWKYNPATNEWTWMRGDKEASSPGVYGTLGTPAPANAPGGRSGAIGWTDEDNNLWLFGGEGVAKDPLATWDEYGWLNDLWKYSIATNQWTWMGGSDGLNNPGFYGYLGTPATTNKPGARSGSNSWTDAAGNFWLYGGCGAEGAYDYNCFTDLWRYNPVTREWTWIGGDTEGNHDPVFGEQGVADENNNPGTRFQSVSWTDGSGNFWLYSGSGASDLWKYTVSTTTPVIEPVSKAFGVTVAPNPSTRHFTLNIVSRNNTPVEIIITDMLGRVVERVPGTRANGHLQLGHAYQPGVYYAEVIQGKDRIIVALMKQ